MKGPRIVKKKSIDTAKDPYLNKADPADGSECGRCGAIFTDKRWSISKRAKRVAGAAKVTCPACQKIKDGYIGGYVTLQGDFLKEHKDDLLNLIRNKEKLSMRYNPLNRIMDIKERGGKIEITTTSEKLAQRIGQVVKKTFSGEVEYKWSSDVKVARVVWTR